VSDALAARVTNEDAAGTPAIRKDEDVTSIGILDAIYGRRSVRDYTPELLDESTVRSLLAAAVQAPTAMHEEPWSFVVVQDVVALKRISDRAKALWRREVAVQARPGGGRGPDAADLAKRLADPEFNIFYNASTLIVIATTPRGQFVIADCWLAAENLMLAAHGLGLGSCCIGFALGALGEPSTKAELALPANVIPVAAVIVGQVAAAPPPIGRKPPAILSWLKAAPPATGHGR
jgi:nitroreductase